MQSTFTFK